MPKLKSHSGASKRLSKRGKGSIKYKQAYSRHLLTKKSRKRKRQLKRISIVSQADTKQANRMLV
jgi:large subunit ribosomal protein L35